MADQEKAETQAAPKYYVRNMVRRAQTRTARHRMAGRPSWTQRILDNRKRVRRNKFTTITQAELEKYWDELSEKQAKGLIRVCVGSPRGPAFNFGGAQPKTPELKETVHDEPEDKEEAADDAAAEAEGKEGEDVDSRSEKEEVDVDAMRKAELVRYASKILGEEEGVLEKMTKAEIKELLS